MAVLAMRQPAPRCHPQPLAVILSAAKDLALPRWLRVNSAKGLALGFCLEGPKQGEMLREDYPERQSEILRFAQNDSERAQNDSERARHESDWRR